MPPFIVTYLQESELALAFPLVRSVAPEAGLARWQAYARSLFEAEGGVLGVSTGGSLQGIAIYRPEETLRHGRTLRVETIVSFELNQAAPARAAMCEALELLAASKGCPTLTVTMPSRGYVDPQSDKADRWATLGLAADSVVFSRKVEAAGAPTARRSKCA